MFHTVPFFLIWEHKYYSERICVWKILIRYARYSNISDILNDCSTTNGTISVDSTIYAVKKGEYSTIKVNWHRNGVTAYYLMMKMMKIILKILNYINIFAKLKKDIQMKLIIILTI